MINEPISRNQTIICVEYGERENAKDITNFENSKMYRENTGNMSYSLKRGRDRESSKRIQWSKGYHYHTHT